MKFCQVELYNTYGQKMRFFEDFYRVWYSIQENRHAYLRG